MGRICPCLETFVQEPLWDPTVQLMGMTPTLGCSGVSAAPAVLLPVPFSEPPWGTRVFLHSPLGPVPIVLPGVSGVVVAVAGRTIRNFTVVFPSLELSCEELSSSQMFLPQGRNLVSCLRRGFGNLFPGGLLQSISVQGGGLVSRCERLVSLLFSLAAVSQAGMSLPCSS